MTIDILFNVLCHIDDQHVMASANMSGDITLWDLDKRKLHHLMKGAHDGMIPSIQFFNGQPILITSGTDNAIKVNWGLFSFLS